MRLRLQDRAIGIVVIANSSAKAATTPKPEAGRIPQTRNSENRVHH
jgi:hypothetical protein